MFEHHSKSKVPLGKMFNNKRHVFLLNSEVLKIEWQKKWCSPSI